MIIPTNSHDLSPPTPPAPAAENNDTQTIGGFAIAFSGVEQSNNEQTIANYQEV